MSALQALAAMGNDTATSSPAASVPFSGNFVATVANGATIRLTLNADGTFAWQANKDGKASSFQGNFTMQNGTLSLNRADSQKLEGALTMGNNGFALRLAGQTEMNLNFVRG